MVSKSMCVSGERDDFCENCDRKKFGMGWLPVCLSLLLPFFPLARCSIDYLNGIRMNKRAGCFTMR